MWNRIRRRFVRSGVAKEEGLGEASPAKRDVIAGKEKDGERRGGADKQPLAIRALVYSRDPIRYDNAVRKRSLDRYPKVPGEELLNPTFCDTQLRYSSELRRELKPTRLSPLVKEPSTIQAAPITDQLGEIKYFTQALPLDEDVSGTLEEKASLALKQNSSRIFTEYRPWETKVLLILSV
jgi:hypothetical protein